MTLNLREAKVGRRRGRNAPLLFRPASRSDRGAVGGQRQHNLVRGRPRGIHPPGIRVCGKGTWVYGVNPVASRRSASFGMAVVEHGKVWADSPSWLKGRAIPYDEKVCGADQSPQDKAALGGVRKCVSGLYA